MKSNRLRKITKGLLIAKTIVGIIGIILMGLTGFILDMVYMGYMASAWLIIMYTGWVFIPIAVSKLFDPLLFNAIFVPFLFMAFWSISMIVVTYAKKFTDKLFSNQYCFIESD